MQQRFLHVLTALALALTLTGCGRPVGPAAVAPPPEPFRLVVLPDTQNYEGVNAATFGAQTQWIVENHEALNIRFVVHEGDIVNNNRVAQWENAQAAMRRLDGVVPYAVAPGNHDIGEGGRTATRETTLFNQYFPVAHYSAGPTFGGVYSAEPDRYDNNVHVFRAGGIDWLVLSLEFGPRDAVLDWANQVVAAHPNHRVIVVTHAYLWSNETRHDPSETWDPHHYGVKSSPEGVNNGEDMWNKFIRKHHNIQFVLNGHVLNDGQGRLVSVGDHGNRVYQMLANYQMLPNGGNGYLRILEFDPANRRVSATSYSPMLGNYLTDPANQFTLDNVDLAPHPTASKALLYHDNFDDGRFDGYSIVDEGTIDGPSKWQWIAGEVVQSANIYGPAVASTTHRKGTFAVYDTPAAYNWSDYRFEATLRSSDDDGIGLLFYYTDPDNYYKLDLDRQRDFFRIFKNLHGVETTLAESAGQYKTGDAMDVTIEIRNGSIRVRLNQAELFGGPVADADLTKGTIALYSWGNQNSFFDDVVVENIE